MVQEGSVIPALLLTAAVTALAAGFAAFAPVAEVPVIPHEQIAPQDQALVHIDFFTEKRDVPVEGVDILSSIRRYDLAVYDTQAILERLLSGEPLALHIAGQPCTANLQEVLHDTGSFTGTLSGDGRVHLTISGSVLRGYFETGGIAYWVESTGRYDTVSPENVLYYVFSSADVKGLSGCYLTLYNISNGDLEDSGYPAGWTEADFLSAGREVVPLADADLVDLPKVNETLRTGFIEVPLSENETMCIVKGYRGKIAEYHGDYYLIDFIES
ncbi:hypothetical protein [Methanoculleus oceani]|uniref:Uncharacterized protein n=1 Tax=Methanoculleus oceani TaxID=2184756 RepID=A0ABD4TAW6_9EURY|nr:hypothetical protein [Methanoculleus sp. CWC-02]MCM2465175.1 hypothetical protein [Methanoculleus sp. CWC-02]